jgi:hypothetical protein
MSRKETQVLLLPVHQSLGVSKSFVFSSWSLVAPLFAFDF